MPHLILLTVLMLYAAGLVLALRKFGIGLVQTVASSMVTIAFVWSALHLAYASDVLYAAGLVSIPTSVAVDSVPFAWLWHYIARNGWIVGIAFCAPIWLAAAFTRVLRQRPGNSFESKPLRAST